MAAKKKSASKKASAPNVTPLGNRVLIQEVEEEHTQTESGIIIPETADKNERSSRGKVVAVGEGKRTDSGDIISPQVSVGDTVIYSSFAADTIEVAKQEYAIVSEASILAVIN